MGAFIVKLNDTERAIFENGLEAAKKRLVIAQGAKEGTAVRESVANIEAQIEYLKAALEGERVAE